MSFVGLDLFHNGRRWRVPILSFCWSVILWCSSLCSMRSIFPNHRFPFISRPMLLYWWHTLMYHTIIHIYVWDEIFYVKKKWTTNERTVGLSEQNSHLPKEPWHRRRQTSNTSTSSRNIQRRHQTWTHPSCNILTRLTLTLEGRSLSLHG